MELKNSAIKPMKKYLIIILTLLFAGCSSIPIKSNNGSFKNSLKSEYYKKDNYILDTFSGSQVAGDIIGIFALGLPLGSIAECRDWCQSLNCELNFPLFTIQALTPSCPLLPHNGE